MKRRKPDILLVLAVVTGLGVLVTGSVQSLFYSPTAGESLREAGEIGDDTSPDSGGDSFAVNGGGSR